MDVNCESLIFFWINYKYPNYKIRLSWLKQQQQQQKTAPGKNEKKNEQNERAYIE